jgi:hypothetical protein
MTGHHTPWDSRKPSQTHPKDEIKKKRVEESEERE